MGGDNYRRLVPSGSYIDVNNFKSIKALTNYLVHLDNNPVSINTLIIPKNHIMQKSREIAN